MWPTVKKYQTLVILFNGAGKTETQNTVGKSGPEALTSIYVKSGRKLQVLTLSQITV